MPRSEARARPRARLAAPLAALAAAAALAPAGCGGGDEEPASTEAEQTPPPAASGEPSTAQPPPETAPDGASEDPGDGAEDGSPEEAQEEALGEDAETGPLPCPDLVITPDSGNGLFDVEANGITCEDAAVALEAWGASGFPGTGPPGFACKPVPDEASGRLSCVQEASGGVVEFTQGL